MLLKKGQTKKGFEEKLLNDGFLLHNAHNKIAVGDIVWSVCLQEQ